MEVRISELLAQAQGELARAQAELDRVTNGFRPEEIAQAKAKHDQLTARHLRDEVRLEKRPGQDATVRARRQIEARWFKVQIRRDGEMELPAALSRSRFLLEVTVP